MNIGNNLSEDNLPNLPLRFEVDGIDYSAITENTCMVDRADYGHLTSIDIPASVEFNGTTYAVTAIGHCAFMHCLSLARITLPEGLEEIQAHAFYGCQSLTDITLPESVKTIGGKAFPQCI